VGVCDLKASRLELTATDNVVSCLLAGLGQAYDDEEHVAAVAPNHICPDNRSRSENWTGVALDQGGSDDAALSDYDGLQAFSSSNSDVFFPSSNDHRLRNRGTAYKIHPAFMHSAPSADRFLPSAGRVAYTSELNLPPATCGNAFRPATISGTRVPPPSAHSRTKQGGPPQILSWLFPKSRKKAKPPEMTSPTAIERGNMPQLLTEWGALSMESLKKELAEANAHRDAALHEAAEVRSSLGELATKLVSVEAYCSELKKALRQATNSPSVSRRPTKSIEPSRELSMPVSHEVMVEGFLQIASEARLSVKQLCKALIQQVNEESSDGLSDKLNLLLRPYQLALSSGSVSKHCSKAVLYHLEAIMNQVMFQDFENPAFQRNGSPRCLDPAEDSRQSFAAFVALRNLSWNEVLRKGTKYYSEDFSRFCDRKMSVVVATLAWSRPWPEQLLQCFFVAAKCVWLLHLLAFSFGPPLTILRVQDGRAFDELYMEDILHDRQPVQSPCQVKIMVTPGFYVQDRVLKCRVLKTRSAA
jgi:hypothetical protein